MEQVPKTLDWVKARAECSLEQLFLLLSEVVDSDVKAMEARSKNAKFTLTKPTEKKFVVSKTWDSGGMICGDNVIFELMKNGISVKVGRADSPLFLAKPSLTKVGDCKLGIQGEPEPLELWQVSRKALEDLFFSE